MKNSGVILIVLVQMAFTGVIGLLAHRWNRQQETRRLVEKLLDQGTMSGGFTIPYGGQSYNLHKAPGEEMQLNVLGREALPPLCSAIETNSDTSRFRNAIIALGELGSVAREKAPILLPVVATRAFNERTSALWALGEIGNASPDVLSRISLTILDDKVDVLARMTAFEALIKLAPGSPLLAQTVNAIDGMKDGSSSVYNLKRQCTILKTEGNVLR